MADNATPHPPTQPIEVETPGSESGSESGRSSPSSSAASSQHKLISFPKFEDFEDQSKRSWTMLFAGKKRPRKSEDDKPDSPDQPAVQLDREASLERSMDSLYKQGERLWERLFVVRRCRCCPPSMHLKLCEQRTYSKFKPCLTNFVDIYGSDGPQVYWGMIAEDMKRMIDQAKEQGLTGWRWEVIVLMRLLKRAEERREAAKRECDLRAAPPHSSGETTVIREVQAPPGCGNVAGKRAIAVRKHVKLSIDDHIKPQAAAASTSPTKLVNIDGQTLKVKNQPFGADHLERNSLRRPVSPPKPQLRGSSNLRRSIIAEDVEYPEFTESQARWTQVTDGKITAYKALSDYLSFLAHRYKLKEPLQEQILLAVKQLQSRPDLRVPASFALPTLRCSNAHRAAMTSMEKGVQKIRGLLARMAERINSGTNDKVVGRHDIRKLTKHLKSDIDEIKSVVKTILGEIRTDGKKRHGVDLTFSGLCRRYKRYVVDMWRMVSDVI